MKNLFENNKHFRIVAFLLINGLASYVALKLEAQPDLALIFGGTANYIVFAAREASKNE